MTFASMVQKAVTRDLKIRGREGQDGNGSGHGKLSRVPLCHQKQNAEDKYFCKGQRR